MPFAPRAELLVAGRPAPIPLQAPRVEPGEQAEARGSVRLEGRRPRELTVLLLAGRRELDKSTVTVTPGRERSLSDRVGDWISENAVLLVALLAALILAMGVLLVIVLTRRRAK